MRVDGKVLCVAGKVSVCGRVRVAGKAFGCMCVWGGGGGG